MCGRTSEILSVIIHAHYFLIRALASWSSSRLEQSDVQTVKQFLALCCFLAERVSVVLRSRVVSYSFRVIFSALSRNVLNVSFKYSMVIYSGFVEEGSFQQYQQSCVVGINAFGIQISTMSEIRQSVTVKTGERFRLRNISTSETTTIILKAKVRSDTGSVPPFLEYFFFLRWISRPESKNQNFPQHTKNQEHNRRNNEKYTMKFTKSAIYTISTPKFNSS